MPIHDQGYRRFAGTREPRGRAWLVIMKAGIRSTLARKWLRIILLASWAQFLVRAVVMYFTTTYGQLASSILATNAQTFREFLERQDIFVFFITIFVGAGLIANDRRANALQIYLSKPLTRAEYIAGKAGTLLVFLVAVTWVPAILLLAVQTMLAGNFTFVRANAFLLPAITVYAALQVLLATFTMLALSSLSKSARFVSIMYAGVIFFTDAVFGMLRFLVRASGASLVSPTQSLAQIGDVIFRVPPRHDTPIVLSIVVVLGLIALSILVLERRIRGVEVVA
jgi:ABC-2 type transport system permease protein